MKRLVHLSFGFALASCGMNQDHPPTTEGSGGNPGGGAVTQVDSGAPVTGASGSVRVLVSGLSNPTALTADAANVYVATGSGTSAQILAVPRAGGAATAIATGIASPSDLTLVGSQLYWVAGGATIASLTLPTGAPAIFAPDATSPAYLTATSTDIYWTELEAASGAAIELATRPIAGGAKRVVSTHSGHGIAGPAFVSGTYAYYVGASPTDSVVLRSLTADTGDPGDVLADVATGQIVGMATDGTTIYMAVSESATTGQIVSASITAGAPKVLADGVQGAGSIALGSNILYFTQSATGELWTVSPAGGDAAAIVTGLSRPTVVEVDSAIHVLVADGVVEIAR